MRKAVKTQGRRKPLACVFYIAYLLFMKRGGRCFVFRSSRERRTHAVLFFGKVRAIENIFYKALAFGGDL